jgi:hypothetical protein
VLHEEGRVDDAERRTDPRLNSLFGTKWIAKGASQGISASVFLRLFYRDSGFFLVAANGSQVVI